MSRSVSVALCLALLAGAGCAQPPPRVAPVLDVAIPPEWSHGSPAEERGAQGGVGVEALPWWSTFEDPDLDLLVAETIEHNHDLLAAARRVEAAAAQARIAGADLLPSVSGTFDATARRQNFIGFPSFGGGTQAGTGAPPQVISTTTTVLGVSLDASWEVDLWGRLRAQSAAALADLQAAQADHAAAGLSLAGQVARAWFSLAATSLQIDLARRTIDSLQATVDLVRARFERGLRPSLDLRLALSNLHGAEASLQNRLSASEALTRQVEILAGRYPAGALAARTELPPLPPAVPAGLPADLIARRPDLAAAERRLAASGARVAQARRALYPSLRLTGSGGRRSQELSDLLDGDFTVWSLAAAILQPLFQGGRLRAGVDLAEAREREAAETWLAAALRAYAEVETALSAGERLAAMESALEEASAQAAAARRLAEDRYAAGLDDFLSVLESQRRDIEAEGRLIEVRGQMLSTRVDLHLALGGGFEAESLQQTLMR